MRKEKYIGESQLKGQPSKKLSFQLRDGSVTTSKLETHAVTYDKLSKGVQDDINFLKLENRYLRNRINDFQNQIGSLNEGSAVPISDSFGDSHGVCMSQIAVTEAINNLWSKIEELTGEYTRGISITIDPEFYIGEEGCLVHIEAVNPSNMGFFEKIDLYFNEQHIGGDEYVPNFVTNITINETGILKCVAQIFGVTYTAQKTITHYASYWISAGDTYQDVMINDNLRPLTEGLKANYDITVPEGKCIFVVLGEGIQESFIRADINGVEIPFLPVTVVNGYKVYKSNNPYQEGEYNIDINS
jgi:hypothetical protein